MTAESVNFWASWLLIASLVVGAISTYAIVTSGNIKERELKRELSKANAEAEKAKATAAEANAKTAALNLRVEEESRKRVEAELALETLRAKLRGRFLTGQQRDILFTALQALSGSTVVVGSIGDKEASDFAAQIISVLEKAGLVVNRIVIGTLSPPQYGVIISPDPSSAVLRDAFRKADIDYTKGRVSSTNIFIGLKPPIDT